jgi:hypothetical protein
VALVFGFLKRGSSVYNILLLHSYTIAKFKNTTAGKPRARHKIWCKIPIRPLVRSCVGGWLRGFFRNVFFLTALLRTSIVQIRRFLLRKLSPEIQAPSPLTSRTTAPEHPRHTTPSYPSLPEAQFRCTVIRRTRAASPTLSSPRLSRFTDGVIHRTGATSATLCPPHRISFTDHRPPHLRRFTNNVVHRTRSISRGPNFTAAGVLHRCRLPPHRF